MIYKHTLYSLLIFCLCFTFPEYCYNQVKHKQNDRPDIINFSSIVNVKKDLKLSQMVKDVKYISLQTKQDCLIGDIDVLKVSSDRIFLISRSIVYCFMMDGSFYKKIGNRGNGPGEYIKPRDLTINEDTQSVYILDSSTKLIYEYSFSGNYKQSIKLPDNGHSWQIEKFGNDLIVVNQILPPINYQLYQVNKKGKLVYPFLIMSELKGSSLYPFGFDYASFKPEGNFLLFTSAWNDTLFLIKNNNKPKPVYIVNYGKFKYPLNTKVGSLINQPIKSNFIFQYWKAITDRYLLFQYQYHSQMLLAVYDFEIDAFIYNGDIEDGINPGIGNDIDGGPGIQKIYQYKVNNGNTLVKSFMAMDIIELYKQSLNENLSFSHPQKRNDFIELAKNLNENDNPVLQLLTLK